jgi:hypothetical protein
MITIMKSHRPADKGLEFRNILTLNPKSGGNTDGTYLTP